MHFAPNNWFAIVGAVISAFVIGGLWYSPLLFVNSWMRMSGVSKQTFDAGLPKALLGDLFASAATALVMNQVIDWSGATNVVSGVLVAFVVWVGFVASTLLSQVTYEHRPFRFFAISSGYRLVTLLVMGAILSMGR